MFVPLIFYLKFGNLLDFCTYKSLYYIYRKRGEKMSAKMGRPTDNPKNIRFEIRLDNDTNEKLEKCSSELNLTKTDVIRKGIDLVEKSIKK